MATALLAFMAIAFVFIATCKDCRKECYANTHDKNQIHQMIPPVKSVVLSTVYLIDNQIEMMARKNCDKNGNTIHLIQQKSTIFISGGMNARKAFQLEEVQTPCS